MVAGQSLMTGFTLDTTVVSLRSMTKTAGSIRMTRDDIIRMARQASVSNANNVWLAHLNELERFANLIAAAEREACAKVVEEWLHGEWHNQGVIAALMIRERGAP